MQHGTRAYAESDSRHYKVEQEWNRARRDHVTQVLRFNDRAPPDHSLLEVGLVHQDQMICARIVLIWLVPTLDGAIVDGAIVVFRIPQLRGRLGVRVVGMRAGVAHSLVARFFCLSFPSTCRRVRRLGFVFGFGVW